MSNIRIKCNSKASKEICNKFSLSYKKYKDFKFEIIVKSNHKNEIIKNDRSNTCLSEKNPDNKLFVILYFTTNLYLDLTKILSLCPAKEINIITKEIYKFKNLFHKFFQANSIKNILIENEYKDNLGNHGLEIYKHNINKTTNKIFFNIMYYFKIHYFTNSVKYLQIFFVSDYYLFPNKLEIICVKNNNVSTSNKGLIIQNKKYKQVFKIPYNLKKFTIIHFFNPKNKKKIKIIDKGWINLDNFI